MPLSDAYKPDPAILELGETFYDPVQPAAFPKTVLRYRDDVAASQIGLDQLSEKDWVFHFGQFAPLPDNLAEPLALRYHGHQFQVYNPDLGDGRGFLFAQMRDKQSRLMDLGTKGSGQTPYSRQGDGRLTLLGGVREVLAARYLEHMGVPTCRIFSLIETGEDLYRSDEPSPTRSAVMVRLNHSHIRFGTFQRQAFFNASDNIAALTDYCRRHFYPDSKDVADFFRQVVKASANTVASWMAAGFVHGVMNTDNMNITGETFDYGPYRFLPTLKAGFTAAYFDHNGLYAFSRQPEIMAWNLGQLAYCLSLITEDGPLTEAINHFADDYRDALIRHVFRRLGLVATDTERDIAFVLQTFRFLEESQAGWPQFWHDWHGGGPAEARALKSSNKEFYKGEEFSEWLRALKSYEPASTPYQTDQPASLIYEEIGELWTPIDQEDDWSAFKEKLSSFERAE